MVSRIVFAWPEQMAIGCFRSIVARGGQRQGISEFLSEIELSSALTPN
jgi:hypothetical protein